MNRLDSFLSPLFAGFRLTYIPLSILIQSGHGAPIVTTALALLLSFGLEWVSRRGSRVELTSRPLLMVAIALVLIGLFPEEAPIHLILWAGSGAAWGRAALPWPAGKGTVLLVSSAGLLLGMSALLGPGAWLFAAILLGWLAKSG